MKTTTKILLSLFAMAMFGCGGSSSGAFSAKNPFGEIPNLFAKFEAEIPSLSDVNRKDITPELMKEVQNKTQILYEQLDKEIPNIIGNKVPFSGSPSALLEVTDCVISSADRNQNECRVDIDVLYGVNNAQVSDTKFYALFVDHSNNPLHYARLRISTSGDAHKSSKLFVQLPKQNFADFKEVRFITEQELQSILTNNNAR